MPPTPEVAGLDWSEEAERHVETHIDATLVDECIAGQNFFTFSNTHGHPPNRLKVIGRTPGGFWVTVIVEQHPDRDPQRWRPITAWSSSQYEKKQFLQENARRTKKRGKLHG